MRDDDPAFHEEMDRIERNERIARGYLDDVAPHPDPILDLPLAEADFVKTKPQLQKSGAPTCGAVARYEVAVHGVYLIPVMTRSRVSCRLVPGHDGPHIAKAQRELPGIWRVWEWSETSDC